MADNTIHVVPLAALKDNYIWCIHNRRFAVMIDPGEAKPVVDFLGDNALNLVAIFNTHHHADHVGGNVALKNRYNAPIYGPASEIIPSITDQIREPAQVTIEPLSLSFQIIDIPGHTTGHIAYYGSGMLFCGDTLFSCGCGRLFEGTPGQMYQSLQKLSQLPDTTKVYCGHEYTLANIRFAKTVDPDNRVLLSYENKVQSLRKNNLPSLPSSIGLEKSVNPFLRCNEPNIIALIQRYLDKTMIDPISVFSTLREWKNNF